MHGSFGDSNIPRDFNCLLPCVGDCQRIQEPQPPRKGAGIQLKESDAEAWDDPKSQVEFFNGSGSPDSLSSTDFFIFYMFIYVV